MHGVSSSSFFSFVESLLSFFFFLGFVQSCLFLWLMNQVSESANFGKDLELDFLDTVELVMAFEEEFALEIPNAEADKLSSCAAAIDYIASHPRAK